MNQVSPRLRRVVTGYAHYCAGCARIHILPDGWEFNGDESSPTFTPSLKHSWGDARVCHYVLTAGVLNYCDDSTHSLAGQSVPLPDLPRDLADGL